MSAVLAQPAEVDRVLQLTTVREPAARALILNAVRDLGRDGAEFGLLRLQQLIAVDQRFNALLQRDQAEFLREARAVTEADREFALNVQRICLEAANGFQRFLRNRNAWATTREALDVMFHVTGLALNAIHGFVKWGYFLNEPGRTVPWKQLHALYSLAESDGYSQVPFVLHASQPEFKPSVQSLYLRTLILDLLNTGNLTRVQTEIADGWFSAWCTEYALDTEYSSRQHLFYVDIASDSGMHLMRRDSHGESMRYVRIDNLRAQIEEVQAGLRQGRLYGGHGAGEAFPMEEHVALLSIIEKLYHSILTGSENRIEERTHFEDREVDVTVGVDRVLRKVHESAAQASAPVAGPAGMDQTIQLHASALSLSPLGNGKAANGETPAEDAEVQRWRVHDLSSKGYGLVVDRATAEGVLLNGLVALRNQQAAGWIVCTVVRKLANRARGEMLVGLEVLSFHPIAIELKPAAGGEASRGLFLPGADANGKLDSMLVQARDFTADKEFVVRASGSAYRVRLNRIIRKGVDWIKARFEIDSKA